MLQILMSVKRNWPASAQSANAKIPGGVMSANAVVVCSTRKKMMCVWVRLLLVFLFLPVPLLKPLDAEGVLGVIS